MEWWNRLPSAQRRTILIGGPVALVLGLVAFVRGRGPKPVQAQPTDDVSLPPGALTGAGSGAGGGTGAMYGPPGSGAVGIDSVVALRNQISGVTTDLSESLAGAIAAQQAASAAQEESSQAALQALREQLSAQGQAFLDRLAEIDAGARGGQPSDPTVAGMTVTELQTRGVASDSPDAVKEQAAQAIQQNTERAREEARQAGVAESVARNLQGTPGERYDPNAAVRSAEVFVGSGLTAAQRSAFLEQLSKQQAGTFSAPNKAQIRSAARAAGIE